jgi:hypothetical protein
MFLESIPRDPSFALQIRYIPDGSTLTDESDPDNYRQWPDDDVINILGTPSAPRRLLSLIFSEKRSSTACC